MDKDKQDDRMDEDGVSNVQSDLSREPEEGNAIPPSQEKDGAHTSLELSRTVSNALSRVTSRMTNRHTVDPGPPPGN